ncbi:MAG: hypothetical protein HY063_09945 [Bacteroidetes bacterium]|nr:hypothetical protein [Bacteroidota bacterium]
MKKRKTMSASEIKKLLHRYIDTADEEFFKSRLRAEESCKAAIRCRNIGEDMEFDEKTTFLQGMMNGHAGMMNGLAGKTPSL